MSILSARPDRLSPNQGTTHSMVTGLIEDWRQGDRCRLMHSRRVCGFVLLQSEHGVLQHSWSIKNLLWRWPRRFVVSLATAVDHRCQ